MYNENNKYEYFKPVQEENSRYSLYNADGVDVYDEMDVGYPVLKRAVANNQALRYNHENHRYRRVPMDMYFNKSESVPVDEQERGGEDKDEHSELVSFIQSESVDLKPDDLFMNPLVWKFLIRNVIRSENVLMVGPTGSGKTKTVRWVAEALDRKLFKFNMGATQDPRSALIGNMQYDKNKGTFLNQSHFIKAIQTPNAIILLDELSRAHPEAFNILMTVLDNGQRYVRIDEKIDTPIIKVHPTVTFMATANIGAEYSSTRVIDRALKDRFVPVRMEYLSEDEEFQLLSKLFPDVKHFHRKKVAKIVSMVRNDVKSEDGQLEHNLSTRHSIQMVSLINDGFHLEEALELIVWPQYDEEGGADSDRVYVKQLVQSVIEEDPEAFDDDDEEEDTVVNDADDDDDDGIPTF